MRDQAKLRLSVVVLVLAGAACGSDSEIGTTSDDGSVDRAVSSRSSTPDSSSGSTLDLPTTALPTTTSPSIDNIEVDCGPGPRGEPRELVAGQEFAFDGTVTHISPEPNPDAAFRTNFLDDGQDDPDEPGADQGGFRGPDPGTVWPWTTFDVNAWFTNDWGQQITIWTAGLDIAVGDRMLIAGEAFLTSIPEDVEHSGMAVVCASTDYTPDLDVRWQEWFGGAVVPGGNEPEGEADPAAVAEIEAGRVLWQAVEPAAYTATLSITLDEPVQGPCPTDGPLLIVVIDGIVTSAINSARGCRLDPGAQPLPTIDDLFDQAIAAQAAAGDHGYQIDSVWGFPSFHGFDRSIELSGGVSWFHPAATTTLVDDEIPAGLESQRARWRQVAPASYTFALERLCFCADVGPFTVTVTDGETDSITTSDGTPISADAAAGLPGSIEDLFDVLDGATDQHDLVVATFDADRGLPVNIYIDSVANGADDEVAYVAHDLEAT